MSCEKQPEYECKECYYTEDNQEMKVFVCGEELKKFESDNYKCLTINHKN